MKLFKMIIIPLLGIWFVVGAYEVSAASIRAFSPMQLVHLLLAKKVAMDKLIRVSTVTPQSSDLTVGYYGYGQGTPSGSGVTVVNATFSPFGYDAQGELSLGGVDVTDPQTFSVEAVLKPVFYPNPWRVSQGATLGYKLKGRSATNVTLHIYDMKARRVFNETFMAGSPGAAKGYNRICFYQETCPGGVNYNFDNFELSAGVYFYFLIDEDQKVMPDGKGKMAIIP